MVYFKRLRFKDFRKLGNIRKFSAFPPLGGRNYQTRKNKKKLEKIESSAQSTLQRNNTLVKAGKNDAKQGSEIFSPVQFCLIYLLYTLNILEVTVQKYLEKYLFIYLKRLREISIVVSFG